ncbi:MAG: Hpt domain-containing protein [Treponema sp.]|jgi:HPt (histidine-containing phosphotransfer) domain-containing protein|nr:Hpt domain-containing protein [Treponema sp.]
MAENNQGPATDDGVIYVNQAEGLQRVLNNMKLYVKLLTKFKVDINLNELITLVQVEDYENAQVKAHTIKGIAANLSLIELFKQTRALEEQIKNKAAIEEAVLETLQACYRETIRSIDTLIAHHG